MQNFQENPDLMSEFEYLVRPTHKWKNTQIAAKYNHSTKCLLLLADSRCVVNLHAYKDTKGQYSFLNYVNRSCIDI